MDEETVSLLRAVAYLLGVIGGAVAAMLVLLVISIFHEVGLATAFAVQAIAGFVAATVTVWRLS